MIWIYLAEVLVGVLITVRLTRQHSRQAYVAGVGVALGLLAILTGFSIGFLIAPVAALLIVVAASALRSGNRVA